MQNGSIKTTCFAYWMPHFSAFQYTRFPRFCHLLPQRISRHKESCFAGFSACGGSLRRPNSPLPQCDPARRAFALQEISTKFSVKPKACAPQISCEHRTFFIFFLFRLFCLFQRSLLAGDVSVFFLFFAFNIINILQFNSEYTAYTNFTFN